MKTQEQDSDQFKLGDLLEIWIPTYNRAEKLRNILSDLADSIVADCRITVSDNASDDDTKAVCKSIAGRLPNLVYRRQIYNIGANANILEGLKYVSHPYFWIVCDDDRLCFKAFEKQFFDFTKKKVDVMLLASAHSTINPSNKLMELYGGEVVSIRQIMNACEDLVSIMSFLPSVIYRKAILDSSVIYSGYGNCAFMYPHMPLIAKVVNQNMQAGVFLEAVVRRGIDVPPFSTKKRFWLAWCHSCRFLDNEHYRNISKWSVLGGYSFRSWASIVRNLLILDLICPEESMQTYAPLSSFPRVIFFAYLLGSIILAPIRLIPKGIVFRVLKIFFPGKKLLSTDRIKEFAS